MTPRCSTGGRVREARGFRAGPGFVEEYVLREGPGFRELSVDSIGGASGGPSPAQMMEAVMFGHLPPGVRRESGRAPKGEPR